MEKALRIEKRQARAMHRIEKKEDRPKGVLFYFFLILAFSLLVLIPYGWLFVKAFTGVNGGFTLGNWTFLYQDTQVKLGSVLPMIWKPMLNSFLFASVMALCMLVVTTPAAYAISRTSFPGRKAMTKLMIVLDAFPTVALLSGFIFLISAMGLVGKFTGVMLIKVGTHLSGAVWLLKGFFDHVSWDIEWSAIVDGASRFKAFLRIICPAVKPGIAVILVNSFLSGWGEYILVNLFIYGGSLTVSSFIGQMLNHEGSATLPGGVMAAACVFYVIPIIILFTLSQKTLLQVSQGGSKQL